MRKIPTLFKRDPENMKRVLREVTPECKWVLDGEGKATRKFDGTCVLVRDGAIYKRREVKPGKTPPADFEQVDHDEVTGKTVGWVPVGDGPEDRIHRETFAGVASFIADGTYELIGPKINGNPERMDSHMFIPHGGIPLPDVPHDFDGLRDWLLACDYEGIVWHHPDGRMAKLKKRDFA